MQCALGDVLQHVERIVKAASEATVTRTGYTVTVETPGRRYLFADKATTMRCFGAAAKLKGDVLASTFDPGNYRPKSVKYHDFADGIAPECWCVDIRSAYPTALLKLGAITMPTYKALSALDKLDRLKAVGMLASRKFVQRFERGALVSMNVEEAPTAPYFYAACHEVGEVMTAVKHSTPGFLLFWVDGVFIDTPDPAPVADTLAAMGYATSVERVTGMRRSLDGRYLHYTKGNERTYLCLPRRVEYHDAELVRAITNAADL